MTLMWLDWIFIAIVLLSTAVAVFRGFSREAVSLSTWLIALFLSLHYGRIAGGMMGSYVHNHSVQNALGFLLVFFMIMLIGMLIGFLVKLLVSSTGLGFLDMILGGVFGFIRGICIVALGIIFISMPWVGLQTVVTESTIAQYLKPVITWGERYVPSEDAIMSEVHHYLPPDN